MTGERLVCNICGANATTWGIGYDRPRCDAHLFDGIVPLPDAGTGLELLDTGPGGPAMWGTCHGCRPPRAASPGAVAALAAAPAPGKDNDR